jgi:hypothetical protein
VLQLAFTLARNIQYDSPDMIMFYRHFTFENGEQSSSHFSSGQRSSSAFWGLFAFLVPDK